MTVNETHSHATQKQRDTIARLAAERDFDIPALREIIARASANRLSVTGAVMAIDLLRDLPVKTPPLTSDQRDLLDRLDASRLDVPARYPAITVEVTGRPRVPAFIAGRVIRALTAAGVSEAEIAEFTREVNPRSARRTIDAAMRWVRVL